MNKIKKYVTFIIYILIGAVGGYVLGQSIGTIFTLEVSIGQKILGSILLLAELCLVIILQTIIHEGGHLIFGLMTGYRFSSFRVGSLMLIKANDKLQVKRFSLAGTGGQCLMIPPKMLNGCIPYVLYNLGGTLMNILAAVLCGIALPFTKENLFLHTFFLLMLIVGIVIAFMNGIPSKAGGINNDGENALSLGKNPAALRAFWLQMEVNHQLTLGKRLKEMPEEWFVLPEGNDMKDSITVAIAVFAANRLMDELRFAEAKELMEKLLKTDTGALGIYRNVLMNDLIYCELVGPMDVEYAREMFGDKGQQKFMMSMKTYPSVLRTQYAYAALVKEDTEKAEAILKYFEKVAKSYPYPADIESERELLAQVK